MSKLVYLASPYTHNDPEVMQQRFEAACRVQGWFIKHYPENAYIGPIATSHNINKYSGIGGTWKTWQQQDLQLIDKCDELWVLCFEGWEKSVGVQAETDYAANLGRKIKYIGNRDNVLKHSNWSIILDLDFGKQMEKLEIPEEMYDFKLVLEAGAKKYAPNNWLLPDGKSIQHITNCNSMFHHLSDYFAGKTIDKDSGLHPLLHLACRALMAYTRFKRGIKDVVVD